jgi:hypothetical protein
MIFGRGSQKQQPSNRAHRPKRNTRSGSKYAATGPISGTVMQRPKKLHVLTVAPAHSSAAIDEWKTGIEDFLEWANRARTGETSHPYAQAFDRVLTAFHAGRFSDGHVDSAATSLVSAALHIVERVPWFVLPCLNIREHVREGDWHLQLCPFCDRWLLARDRRRMLCRRTTCMPAAKTQNRGQERGARRNPDRGAARRTRLTRP